MREYDKADKTKVILSYWIGDGWKRMAHKIAEVKDKLSELLNLDLKQALDTLLVRQGEVARIADATASQLRELLREVYNLKLVRQMTSQLENLESELDAKINSLEDDYEQPERIETRIDEFRQEIEIRKESLKDMKTETTQVEKELKSLPSPEKLTEISVLTNKVEMSRRDLERVTVDRDQYLAEAGLAYADDTVIKKKLQALKKDQERIKKEIEETERRLSEIDQEIGAIRGQRRDLQEKLDNLEQIDISDEAETVECPTCAKPLTSDERDGIIKDYKGTISTGESKEEEHRDERSKLDDTASRNQERTQEITSAIDALGRIESRQSEVDKQDKLLKELETSLAKDLKALGAKDVQSLLSKYDVSDIRDIVRQVDKLIEALGGLKKRCEDRQVEIDQRSSKIAQLEKDVARMIELGAEIDGLRSMLHHTKYVRLKLVSGFIADYVIQKRLIGIIRGATNEYVRSFTNGQYSSIDLVPTPATGRSGPGLALKVRDDRDSATKKTSQLSFGDRTAISLGLRLGISRTMSSIRPMRDSPAISPRVRAVMLDEPLAGLDKKRRESVVRNLVNDQAFRQIFLITHTDVKDWEGVSVIEIQKGTGGSTATLRTTLDE